MVLPRRGLGSDDGSVVFGWLARLTLTFALLGLIGFEVLSIAVAHVQVQDIGQTAAMEALDAYKESGSATQAYDTASAYAVSQGATIKQKSFTISDEAVTFEVTKTAPTLVLFRWSRTADLAEVETSTYAEPLQVSSQLP
jgi:hypothetical protein